MNMMIAMKEAAKQIGAEMDVAWNGLSEGWHELQSRSRTALTRFTQGKEADTSDSAQANSLLRWGLLTGELEETRHELLVRIELPGLEKKDCEITLEGNTLCIKGEKHLLQQASDSTFHIMERTYGAFQRQIVLPCNVDMKNSGAQLADGVLTVRLPKLPGEEQARKIEVH